MLCVGTSSRPRGRGRRPSSRRRGRPGSRRRRSRSRPLPSGPVAAMGLRRSSRAASARLRCAPSRRTPARRPGSGPSATKPASAAATTASTAFPPRRAPTPLPPRVWIPGCDGAAHPQSLEVSLSRPGDSPSFVGSMPQARGAGCRIRFAALIRNHLSLRHCVMAGLSLALLVALCVTPSLLGRPGPRRRSTGSTRQAPACSGLRARVRRHEPCAARLPGAARFAPAAPRFPLPTQPDATASDAASMRSRPPTSAPPCVSRSSDASRRAAAGRSGARPPPSVSPGWSGSAAWSRSASAWGVLPIWPLLVIAAIVLGAVSLALWRNGVTLPRRARPDPRRVPGACLVSARPRHRRRLGAPRARSPRSARRPPSWPRSASTTRSRPPSFSSPPSRWPRSCR